MELSNEKLLWMFKTMIAIREFEQSLSEAVSGGRLPGFVHLGIGQEAVHVGFDAFLEELPLLVHGEEEDLDLGVQGLDLPGSFQAP